MASNYHIGIDLGGTKIEVAVLDSQDKILYRERLFTEAHLGSEHIFDQIHALYSKAVMSIQNKSHTLGLGTPGSISKKTHLLKNSNTLCLNDLPMQALLEDKLVHDIVIENDANCFALAEAIMGAGIGYPSCYCGASGCVESFISGGGLEKRIKNTTGNSISAMDFFRTPLKDESLKKIKQDFYVRFGQALANLINILDPDIVVLGGGLSNEKSLYKEGVEEVYKRIFNDVPSTPIVRNILGDSAGVIGAALIGKQLSQ